MLSTLKTLRDATLSATITLGLFVTPVGVAAIKNVPVVQEALEAPAEVRVVHLPAPPPVEEAPVEEGPETKPVSEPTSTDKVAKGGEGVPVEAVSRAGRPTSAHRGMARGQVHGKVTGRPQVSKDVKRTSRCTPDNPQIVLEDGGLRVVERGLLDYYTGDIKELNRLGYVKKYTTEDSKKSEGLLVRGVRCGNDLHELGIRNNDVVHSVNGKPLKSLVQAITVYLRIKGQEDFEVELTRGGKRMTLRYRLV